MRFRIPVKPHNCRPCSKTAQRSQNQQRADRQCAVAADHRLFQLTEMKDLKPSALVSPFRENVHNKPESEKKKPGTTQSQQKRNTHPSQIHPGHASRRHPPGSSQTDQTCCRRCAIHRSGELSFHSLRHFNKKTPDFLPGNPSA